MDEGITIEELLNTSKNKDYINVYDKEDVEITDYTQVISTGLKIKLEKEEKIYDQVTIILRGDINEDGVINVTDKVQLQNHILSKEIIEDYRVYAADLEVDDVVNVTDNVKLGDYILKKITSLN